MYKKLLIAVLILVVATAIAWALVEMRKDTDASEPTENVVLVETMQALPTDAYITVMSQGNVEPRTRTTLVSEVNGKVIEVAPTFVAGGFFRKGDILLKLDDSNYKAAVSRNEAAVATAQSALQLELGQGDVAQREWNNMSSAEQARIRAKDLYLRKPQLAEAQARLESAEADLAQSLNELSKTSIAAPYDGLISSKNTDIGQFVNAGSTLAETFAVDYAEVRLPISEAKLPYLDLPASVPGEAGLSPDLGPEVELISTIGDATYRWTGHLIRTEGVLDIRTRVMYSVVRVKDPYGLYGAEQQQPLRIGTFVNAAIQGTLLKDVIILPRYTLQSNNQIWVADQENRLRARQVNVVTVNGDDAYIRGGLLPGDKIITTRLENPLNGLAVQTAAQISPLN